MTQSLRIWVLSDIHEETDPRGKRRPKAPDCDMVIVAGDVREGNVRACVETVAAMAEGRPAVMVLGNHDFYGLAVAQAVREAVALGERLGVHVLERSSCEIEGIVFAGGTLWDDLSPRRDAYHRDERPNLTEIMLGSQPAFFAPPPFVGLGEPVRMEETEAGGGTRIRQASYADIAAIREETMALLETVRPDVVVTHYPPADREVRAVSPGMWVHGHIHAFERRHVGDTEIVVNARQSRIFADRLVVEVPPRPGPRP